MNKEIYKVGYWSGFIAFGSTVAFVLVQALQLFGILSYPWDQILIFGSSLCIVIPFILEILALHYVTPDEKKYWSHAALIFTIIYSVVEKEITTISGKKSQEFQISLYSRWSIYKIF